MCALIAHPLRDRAASCVLGPRTFARTLRRMSSPVDSAVHKVQRTCRISAPGIDLQAPAP